MTHDSPTSLALEYMRDLNEITRLRTRCAALEAENARLRAGFERVKHRLLREQHDDHSLVTVVWDIDLITSPTPTDPEPPK
jgi:hypothetical protein